MAPTIHVSNLSKDTNDTEIRDFFSYCGKIKEISITPPKEPEGTQSANITFERAEAATTALLLDGTNLKGKDVKIEAAASPPEPAKHEEASSEQAPTELDNAHMPRVAIIAEYLSHGYTFADNVLNKAIAMDNKHGISDHFQKYVKTLNQKTGAQDTARSVNTAYNVTGRARLGVDAVHRFLERALGTPTGHKIREFYQAGEVTAMKIHNEAMRLKELREGKETGGASSASDEKPGTVDVGEGKTKCECAGNEGECKCAPGACACEGCQKKHKAA